MRCHNCKKVLDEQKDPIHYGVDTKTFKQLIFCYSCFMKESEKNSKRILGK